MVEQQCEVDKELPQLRCLSLFFQCGLNRIEQMIGNECFNFIVNGCRFESTIVESIFLSPAVEALILNDCNCREFCISNSSIDSNDFSILLDFIRCRHNRDSNSISTSTSASLSQTFSNQKSILSICHSLQNKQLELMTLISLDAIFRIVQSVSTAEIDIDCCASEFYSYSISMIVALSINTLDSILSSDSLRIVNEDWFLNVLFEINVDHSFLFCHLRLEFLSSDSISRLCDSIDYTELTEDIWRSIVNRLKGLCDEGCRQRRFFGGHVSGFDSKVISKFPDILSEFRNQRHMLLYRGSRDGFGSSDFHGKCDGQSHTITLIRTTKDFIFGGYTPLSWDSTNSYKPDSSHLSFIFTIANPHNLKSRKFALRPNSSQYAIRCNASGGPIFGYGHTIHVYNNCAACNSNYTYLSGYVNDTGLDDKTVFTGEQYFTMKEIEVFALTE
jgi:hypothetical protein